MSIDREQFENYIVRPSLELMGRRFSEENAVQLILGTAATESCLGTFIHQLNGNRIGIYQQDPKLYKDLVTFYKLEETDIYVSICDELEIDNFPTDPYVLIYDLRLATIICRLCYYQFSQPLPDKGDILGYANYWKKYYHASNGKVSASEFISSYEKLVSI